MISTRKKNQSSRCGLLEKWEIFSRHKTLNKVLEVEAAELKIQTIKMGKWAKTYTTNQQSERETWKT